MLHSFHFYAKHYCASTYIGFFFFPPTSFKLARFHLLLYFDTLLCSAQVSGKFNAFLLLKVLESWKNWDIRWHRTRSIENLKYDTCKKISYYFVSSQQSIRKQNGYKKSANYTIFVTLLWWLLSFDMQIDIPCHHRSLDHWRQYHHFRYCFNVQWRQVSKCKMELMNEFVRIHFIPTYEWMNECWKLINSL